MGLVLGAFLLVSSTMAQTPTAEPCTVTILNQTARVQPDGTFFLPNVPANLGYVRARVVCTDGGTTTAGTSPFFVVLPRRTNAVPPVTMGQVAPTPTGISIAEPLPRFVAPGPPYQLTVTATYKAPLPPANVSSSASGTVYGTATPDLLSLDSEGRLTPIRSGRGFIWAIHEGIIDVAYLTLVAGDSDLDGIPDEVELDFGLDPNEPADAFEDLDGDGLTNGDEYALGTGMATFDTDGDELGDGFEVGLGTNPLARDTDGDGLEDALELRCGIDPRLVDTDGDQVADGLEDSDGDGVTNLDELAGGTDPCVPDVLDDADGDGMPDFWEELHFLDPNDPSDAGEDPDGDGLTNLQEYQNLTDPFEADTDFDGLSDSEDLAVGTSPLAPDTDGDDIIDGFDHKAGCNALSPTVTAVIGRAVDSSGTPLAGVVVSVGCRQSAPTDGSGFFQVDEAFACPTSRPILVRAVRASAPRLQGGADVVPNVGGVTDVGDLELGPRRLPAKFSGLAILSAGRTGSVSEGDVALGDVDGDGHVDVVAVRRAAPAVAVFLGDGQGGFGPPATIDLGATRVAHEVVVRDLDGDGDGDLVLGFTSSSPSGNGALVLASNGDGSFVSPAVVDFSTANGGVNRIALGHMDGDGILDLLVGPRNGTTLREHFGTVGGGFGPEVPFTPLGTFTGVCGPLQLVDVDGDGLDDLVMDRAASLSAQLGVTLNEGGGQFTGAGSGATLGCEQGVDAALANDDVYPDVLVKATSGSAASALTAVVPRGQGSFDLSASNHPYLGGDVEAVDVDGDGAVDVALVRRTVSIDGEIAVLPGSCDGLFGSDSLVTSGLALHFQLGRIASGDVDGNGTVDLVAYDALSDRAAVLLGRGDGTFHVPEMYATGQAPSGVATGGFVGGGSGVMVVTANKTTDDVSVLRTFAGGPLVSELRYPAGDGPSAIVIADFDRDFGMDVAVANVNAGTVSVLKGNFDGSLQPAVAYFVGAGSSAIAVGDVTGDGFLDLVTNTSGAAFAILPGGGNGTFAARQLASTSPFSYESVEVGDLDGDFLRDVVAAHAGRAEVAVFRGASGGTFLPRATYPAGTGSASIAIADVNLDGVTDVVKSNLGTVSVLLGVGDGTFAPEVRYVTLANNSATSLAVADVDADGRPDVVATLRPTAFPGVGRLLAVLAGTGGGGFGPAQLLQTDGGLDPVSVAIAELDGDGAPEIVTANAGSANVTVMRRGGRKHVLYGGVGRNHPSYPGGLVRVDQVTGAEALIGDPISPGGCSGLAFDAAGALWASSVDGNPPTSRLVQIDPATGGAVLTVGPIRDGPGGPAMSIGDLSIRPGTDVLYGLRSGADNTGNFGKLYTIDRGTGIATLAGAGDPGSQGGSIAFSVDGTVLYQVGVGSLYLWRASDLSLRRQVPFDGFLDGLAVRPWDGRLFGNAGGTEWRMFVIDPETFSTVHTIEGGEPSDMDFRVEP